MRTTVILMASLLIACSGQSEGSPPANSYSTHVACGAAGPRICCSGDVGEYAECFGGELYCPNSLPQFIDTRACVTPSPPDTGRASDDAGDVGPLMWDTGVACDDAASDKVCCGAAGASEPRCIAGFLRCADASTTFVERSKCSASDTAPDAT